MLQRLSIAQTLLTDPQFLILDEPTNGLDPYSQWQVRQIIAALRKQGKTILICSHYLTEIELICSTVGILHPVSQTLEEVYIHTTRTGAEQSITR
jgi:ABC-2 type transport system ATP-binding protein